MISFLKSIPVFSTLTKNLLRRLVIGHEKKMFLWNQIAVKQGDPSDIIHIVRTGSFEVVQVTPGQAGPPPPTVYTKKSKLSEKAVEQAPIKIKLPKNSLRLATLGPGMLFGDDDALANRPYKAQLKCISTEGTVLSFKKEEFLRCFKSHQNDSWKVQLQSAERRETENWKAVGTFLSLKASQKPRKLQESLPERKQLNDLFWATIQEKDYNDALWPQEEEPLLTVTPKKVVPLKLPQLEVDPYSLQQTQAESSVQ